MSFIEILLVPVFKILDFTVTIPIDFEGGTVTFPLKLIFIVIVVAYLISILWENLIGTENSN